METAIGVFSTRDRAEEAVKELLAQKVPQEAIVFLTRSETEATAAGKEAGATVGGFMGFATGMSAGVGAALLLAVPGIGQVFALGFGAAALLGLAGAGAGSAIGKSVRAKVPPCSPLQRRTVLKMSRSFAKYWRGAVVWWWFAPSRTRLRVWPTESSVAWVLGFRNTFRLRCRRQRVRSRTSQSSTSGEE